MGAKDDKGRTALDLAWHNKEVIHIVFYLSIPSSSCLRVTPRLTKTDCPKHHLLAWYSLTHTHVLPPTPKLPPFQCNLIYLFRFAGSSKHLIARMEMGRMLLGKAHKPILGIVLAAN